jgi:hypothetical protein
VFIFLPALPDDRSDRTSGKAKQQAETSEVLRASIIVSRLLREIDPTGMVIAK